MVVFVITVATHIINSCQVKWFCTTLFHRGNLLLTWKTHCDLRFNFEFHFAWTYANANN